MPQKSNLVKAILLTAYAGIHTDNAEHSVRLIKAIPNAYDFIKDD
jgi:hypothetical protein